LHRCLFGTILGLRGRREKGAVDLRPSVVSPCGFSLLDPPASSSTPSTGRGWRTHLSLYNSRCGVYETHTAACTGFHRPNTLEGFPLLTNQNRKLRVLVDVGSPSLCYSVFLLFSSPMCTSGRLPPPPPRTLFQHDHLR